MARVNPRLGVCIIRLKATSTCFARHALLPSNALLCHHTDHPEGRRSDASSTGASAIYRSETKLARKRCAYFGALQAQYCEAHKGPDDMDQRKVKCCACGLCGRLDEQGRCRDCNPDTFERKIKEKQLRVQHWLDNNHTTPYTLTDRHVFVYGLGCIKQRPDFLYDFPTHVLILEVDEDQHKSHSLCDETRMINIAQNLRRKTIFIRYNPDEYSCEGLNGNCTHEERMLVLRGWISKLENVENVAHFVSCVYLFFDGFDEQKVPVVELKNPLEEALA